MQVVYTGSGGGTINLYLLNGGANLPSMATSFWLFTGASVAQSPFLRFRTHGPGAGWFSDYADIGYVSIEGNGQLHYRRTDGLIFMGYPTLAESFDVIRPYSAHLVEVVVVPYTQSASGHVVMRIDGVQVGLAGPVATSNTASGQVGLAIMDINAPPGGSVGYTVVLAGDPGAAVPGDMTPAGAVLGAELVPVSDSHREWKPKTDPTQSWPDVDETIAATDGDATAVEAWGGRIDQLAVDGAGGGIVVPLYAQPQVRARALGSSPYTRLAVGSAERWRRAAWRLCAGAVHELRQLLRRGTRRGPGDRARVGGHGRHSRACDPVSDGRLRDLAPDAGRAGLDDTRRAGPAAAVRAARAGRHAA